ncbi:peptidoglycan-binding domain-containing protein [Streptomyces alboniger]|uniref:Peptidoglycan-binding protein n=1 Tax=Streptomyces alboniger TaxID=132473 RepID=A0A5J6HGN0_STRAD|nr:peptidoglycan-binding domain-containing protein [Streptomyces alboniger]QEV18708.1 peptidoglycan-binding protein [Streptomyces alboniger]
MKRSLIGVLAAASLAGAALATAAPTQAAALPTCTTYREYQGLYVFSTASGSINCQLAAGTRSSGAVPQLQRNLRDCDRYQRDVTVDGIFGQRTVAALRWVQNKEGVPPTGAYGPATRDKMYFMVAGSRTECRPLNA